jgi:cutinase
VPRDPDCFGWLQVCLHISRFFFCSFIQFSNNSNSQGTAVIAGAIPKLSETIRAQIKGVVLFGYTKNKQNNGGIKSYPTENVKVFCAPGDLVCSGTLTVTAAHFTYFDEAAGPAPQFLESKIGA